MIMNFVFIEKKIYMLTKKQTLHSLVCSFFRKEIKRNNKISLCLILTR